MSSRAGKIWTDETKQERDEKDVRRGKQPALLRVHDILGWRAMTPFNLFEAWKSSQSGKWNPRMTPSARTTAKLQGGPQAVTTFQRWTG